MLNLRHRHKRLSALVFAIVVLQAAFAAASEGTTFLGMDPPGPVPVPLDPEIFSYTATPHGCLTFNADDTEVYWSTFGSILYSSFNGETLSPPATPTFNTSATDTGPSFSHDGLRLFFSSGRPAPGGSSSTKAVWYAEHLQGGGWTDAMAVDSTICDTMYQGQTSLAANNDLYFDGKFYSSAYATIFLSRYVDGTYQRFEELEGPLAAAVTLMIDPFVDPLERFMLFSGQVPGMNIGALDIYVSYKEPDGTWGAPVNLGPTINLPGTMHRFPSVSRDGRFLFFVRNVGTQYPGQSTMYYWVNASALSVLPCCEGKVGDANDSGDETPTIGDISAMIDAKFIAESCDGKIGCPAEADVNLSASGVAVCDDITIGDISMLVDYLFITGSENMTLPDCP